ncbi:MAG: hypothetical protein ACFWTZ_09555 [Burkholderia sp.]|jgi:tetratricopeptide (TPR) repeat protein
MTEKLIIEGELPGEDGAGNTPRYQLEAATSLYEEGFGRKAMKRALFGISQFSGRVASREDECVRLRLIVLAYRIFSEDKEPWSSSSPVPISGTMREIDMLTALKPFFDLDTPARVLTFAAGVPAKHLPGSVGLLVGNAQLRIAASANDAEGIAKAEEILRATDTQQGADPVRLQALARCAAARRDWRAAGENYDAAFRLFADADCPCRFASESLDLAVRAFKAVWKDREEELAYLRSVPEGFKTPLALQCEAFALATRARIPDIRGDMDEARSVLGRVPAASRGAIWQEASGLVAFKRYRLHEAYRALASADRLRRAENDPKADSRWYVRVLPWLRAKAAGETVYHELPSDRYAAQKAEFAEALGEITEEIAAWSPLRMLLIRSKWDADVQYVVTMGLSSYLDPENGAETDAPDSELVMTLPRSADLSGWKEKSRESLPLWLMGEIGRRIMISDFLPEAGSLVQLDDKVRSTLGTDFAEVLFDRLALPEGASGTDCRLLETIALYADEAEYWKWYGARALLARLRAAGIPPESFERKSVCADGGWEPAIPAERLRTVLKDADKRGRALLSRRIFHGGAEPSVLFHFDSRLIAAAGLPENFSGWCFFADDVPEISEASPNPFAVLFYSGDFAWVDLNTVCNYIPAAKPWLEKNETRGVAIRRIPGTGAFSEAVLDEDVFKDIRKLYS